MSWTPEREALLKHFWSTGLSASQIAKRLGGVSKSAVISKKDRMGLPARASDGGQRESKAQYARARGKEPPPLISMDRSRETGAERGTWNVRYANKSDFHCLMFLGGESRETGLICGRPREEGKPYCVRCARLAYLPAEAKRRAA